MKAVEKKAEAPARAINFDAQILDLDDRPVQNEEAGDDGEIVRKPLTLRTMVLAALTGPEIEIGPDGRPRPVHIDEGVKLQRFVLAMVVKKRKAPRLKLEDLSAIKKRIDNYYTSPLLVARAFQILDPDDERLTLREE